MLRMEVVGSGDAAAPNPAVKRFSNISPAVWRLIHRLNPLWPKTISRLRFGKPVYDAALCLTR